MKCIYCPSLKTKVYTTIQIEHKDKIKRYRKCGKCNKSFCTIEDVDYNTKIIDDTIEVAYGIMGL